MKYKISKSLVLSVLAILFLVGLVYTQGKRIERCKSEIELKAATIESYEYEMDSITNVAIVQTRTIYELNKSRDSINNKLAEKISELKIKDNKIKELQYLQQVAKKRDSIFIKDTIFVDNFQLDTTLSDKWYKLDMHLSYPNNVVIEPEFRSELVLVKHVEKEYVGKPRKCWLFRLFQRKMLVEKVNIVENNPYIKTTFYRDVQINN